MTEYAEDDYLIISGIQHFKFCRRQWALIHVEQQWEENVHTVVRALLVASRSLGISGECDVVEFFSANHKWT